MPYVFQTNRYFGVEMEINRVTRAVGEARARALTQPALRSALTRAGCPLGAGEGYFHSDGTTWDVKTDSSCGWEVATRKLKLDQDGHCEELRSGCDALAALRPSINDQCGLHVHVDVSDFQWNDLQRLIALWCRYEPFFYSVLPASRRANHYCSPLRMSEWRTEPTGTAFSGYLTRMLAATNAAEFRTFSQHPQRTNGLNLTHWWRTGRIEFRLHSGTVQYEKVRHWVGLLLALVARVKSAPETTTARRPATTIHQPTPEQGFNPEYVLRVLGLLPTAWNPEPTPFATSVAGWVQERAALFASATPRRGAGTVRYRGTDVPEPTPGYASLTPETAAEER